MVDSQYELTLGSSGKRVTEVQRMLEWLGHDLPRFGVDGWYGEETDDALQEFAQQNCMAKLRGQASYTLLNKLDNVFNSKQIKVMNEMQSMPVSMVDMRDVPGNQKRRGLPRSLRSITGITLHQTATCFLLDKDFDKPARVERSIERASKVAVHNVVLRNGDSVWCAPYDHEMPQAQRVFNKTDVGVEIDGWYAGVDGDDKTFWRPASRPDRQPMDLTDEQVEAAIDTLRFIIKTVEAAGGQVRYIHAHRQTSASRRSDPGEQIWKRIAVPIMKEFGLSYGGPDFYVPNKEDEVESGVWTTRGPGLPIPKEWDDTAEWGYYQRPNKPSKQV